jgi:hypothetical protein
LRRRGGHAGAAASQMPLRILMLWGFAGEFLGDPAHVA